MDERRENEPAVPAGAPPADPIPVQPVGGPGATGAPVAAAQRRAARPRRWMGPLGLMTALALSFAWGALTFRELGTQTRVVTAPIAVTAVAGSEAPPEWIGAFAKAFCAADATYIGSRLGPPLSEKVGDIGEALASREWTCNDTRYLGGGQNSTAQFYAYITLDDEGDEQWWVFTVADEKVIGID